MVEPTSSSALAAASDKEVPDSRTLPPPLLLLARLIGRSVAADLANEQAPRRERGAGHAVVVMVLGLLMLLVALGLRSLGLLP